jgi:hypothetical protein
MKYLFLCLLVVGCAIRYVEMPSEPTTIPAPKETPVENDTPDIGGTVKKWKTITLNLPDQSSQAMIKANEYFKQYSNSDEFFEMLESLWPDKLNGGNYSSLKQAIKDHRSCLDKGGNIDIYWYNYGRWSNALGGFDGEGIAQNSRIDMYDYERAAHWQHEVSHYCGFSHISNNIRTYPIIEESYPYVVGYAFEKFLQVKIKKESSK